MRFLVAALVIAASVAVSGSLAEELRPGGDWDETPTARNFSHNYPDRAVQAGVPGAAVICCTINDQRRLDCTAPIEWPANYGFGDATLRISREFRASEAYYARWREDPQPIQRMIVWRLGASAELDAVLDRIREGSRNVCRTPVAASEGAPEPSPGDTSASLPN